MGSERSLGLDNHDDLRFSLACGDFPPFQESHVLSYIQHPGLSERADNVFRCQFPACGDAQLCGVNGNSKK